MKLNLTDVTDVKKLVDMGFVIIPLCSANHKGMTPSHIKGCQSPGKRPLVSKWSEIKNVSNEQFKTWSEQFPTANWGMVLGQTLSYNLVGVDIDGDEGEQYWNELIKDKVVPATVEFTTGAGRRLLYQLPYGLETKKQKTTLDGNHAEVAFCCQGQQTVIPPSVHHTGRVYEWVPGKSPFEIDIAQAPQWIIDLVSINGGNGIGTTKDKAKSTKVTSREMKSKVSEGGRNNQLARLMGSMIARTDMSLEVAIAAAQGLNETQFEPPLPDDEVVATVTSVWEREQRRKDQRERKQMDADEMAPVNLARLFIADMEEQGIYFRYYAERDMFYIAELQTPPWKYISNAKLEAYISAFLRGIASKLDVQRNRTEVRKCMANLMMMDGKYDGEKLDIGLHPYEDLIAVQNGVLDWKTGKLHPWNPMKHNHSSVIEAPFMMKLEHFADELEMWEDALKNWLPDEKNRLFLQEYMGYALLPKNDMRTALFLLGGGSNGKSLFIEVVQKLFEGSVAVTQPESLASRFGTNILLDKLLYVCADVDQTYLDKTGVLKQIIAGDIIPSEIKNGASFHFRPVGKLIISANDMPRAKDSTEGWYSRLQIVPFNRKFAKNPKYKRMMEATFDKPEGRAALLHWCVEGLKRLSENYEWTISEEMDNELRKYKAENDSVIQFFDECLEKTTIEDAYLETPTLYDVYKDWCLETNQKAVTRKIFSNRFTKLGIEIKPKIVKKPLGKKTIRCCFGLKFQDMMDFDADTLYKMRVAN